MDAESSEVTTTILVSNLHCGRQVPTIQDALASLSPPPSSVEVSIVTQSVTVQHSRALSPAVLKAAIDDAGYDILGTPVAEHGSLPPTSWSDSLASLSRIVLPRHAKHLENCAQ
ncbi:hypothetical protein C8Q80DRAFT_1076014, partial [Daedaleopsis nitida]